MSSVRPTTARSQAVRAAQRSGRSRRGARRAQPRRTATQVHFRFYVGRFAGPTNGEGEKRIRAWRARQIFGGGPIEVYGVRDVLARVMNAAAQRQYRNHTVLVTLKALAAAGDLKLTIPSIAAVDTARNEPDGDPELP